MKLSMFDNITVILEEYGKRIREYRIKMSMTQEDLSNQSGVSLRTISNVENGKSITMDNFLRILKALNLEDSINLIIPDTTEIITSINDGDRKRFKMSEKKEWKWGDER